MFLTEARLDRAQALFSHHGGKIVTVARFIEGLRQLNGIIAGISRMHWATFVAFNALGATLWVATWLTLGYVAGSHIDSIYHTIAHYELYAGIAIAVGIVALIARHLLHRREHR